MMKKALVVIDIQNDITKNYNTFKPNTRGAELTSDLKIVSNNVFTKSKGNALTSEEFVDFINKNEISDFYITGADAVACVKSTCYNLRKANYTVSVLSDCITSYDRKNNENGGNIYVYNLCLCS